MIEDAALLRDYAENRSEVAFAELVQRHLGLVYSVALRQVERDAHLAEDVAQKVFSDLARKAAPLSRHPVLTGWLYRSTQFTAIDVMRSERRRRAREQEAQTMHELTTHSGPEVDAEKLRPVLDQVMGELNDRDRDVVMLRFFEGRPFADVGAKLRLTEDAARMRVERALEKMRHLLVRRGVTSTTAVLAVTLANQAAVSAPLGLAASVTGAALSGAASGGVATAVTFMSMTKLQIGIASALILAGTGGLTLQQRTNAGWRREIQTLHGENQDLVALREENRRLKGIAVELETYRNDTAEMARLRDQATALVNRLKNGTREQPRASGSAAADTNSAVVYNLADLDEQPKVTSQGARPLYPFELKRAGISGEAVVSFIIGTDGEVRDIQGVKSTHPDFESAAIEAIKRWKFRSGQKAGLPVNARMQVPIVFNLSSSDTSAPAWF